MRVLLAGDFHWDRLAASYRRSFELLGHEVTAFDVVQHRQNLAWWLRDRIPHRLTIRSMLARRLGAGSFNLYLLEAVKQTRPELVLIFNGDFIMPLTIRSMREHGSRVFIFHADNPFPPHYNNRPETLACGMECDLYLVWSAALVKRLREIGIRSEFLPFGWDPEVFPYQGKPQEQPYDVAFIGGWDPGREIFLDEVSRHFQLSIWGPEYWGTRTRKNSAARKCWKGGPLSGKAAAEVIARSKINLNILRRQHYTDGNADGVIMRTFEVPGAGGFLMSTRSGGAVDLFAEDTAASYFDNVGECLNRIEFYLSHQGRRHEITEWAHNLTEKKHQYHHRVAELLEHL